MHKVSHYKKHIYPFVFYTRNPHHGSYKSYQCRAMDRFNESFDGEIKIPSTSIPQILYSGYRIVKDKKSFSRLAEKVSEFIATYDSNEEYKQYVQSGTGSKENVKGLFDYWRGIVKTLQ